MKTIKEKRNVIVSYINKLNAEGKIRTGSYNKLIEKAKKGRTGTIDVLDKGLVFASSNKAKVSWESVQSEYTKYTTLISKHEKSMNELEKFQKKQKKIIKTIDSKPNKDFFDIVTLPSSFSNRFGIYIDQCFLRPIVNNDQYKKYDIVLGPFIKAIMKIIKSRKLKSNDKINIVINTPLRNDKAWSSGFHDVEYMINEGIEIAVYHYTSIFQSNDEVSISDVFISVQSVKLPKAGAYLTVFDKEDIYKKKCVINIKNTDNLCIPRSIACLLAIRNEKNKNTKDNIIRGVNYKPDSQRKKAFEIMEKAGIDKNKQDMLNYEDILKIEESIQIQIKIIDEDNGRAVLTSGNLYDSDPLFLYKNNNHIVPITSINAFYSKDKSKCIFCNNCNKPFYSELYKHKCKAVEKCKICKSFDCDFITFIKDKACWKYCEDCNRTFPSEKCFEEHIKIKTCNNISKCKGCGDIIYKYQKHLCGSKECPKCKVLYKLDEDHKCFMQPVELAKPSENIIFFDFECNQETGSHEVNLCIAQYLNGDEFFKFRTNDEFCKWLFAHNNYTVIAHNGRGYDFQFILKYCIENTIVKEPYVIYAGSKIMYMYIKEQKIRFVDSLNFIGFPLSDFPETFGIEELKKGYFPHFFNTDANQNYKGKLPAKKYYGYTSFKKDSYENFNKWHDEMSKKDDYVFDFQKEIEEYCKSDVNILKRSCKIFRELFLEIAKIDPFQYITIASVCMEIYRNQYLPKDKVAISENVNNGATSKKAMAWLSKFPGIRHAYNGGEQKIKCNNITYNVDGYDAKTKTVYEFQGCFWHGCPVCYKDDQLNPKVKKTMGEIYKEHKKRMENIMMDYNVVEIWEHDFHDEVTEDKMPINPRDAFFGGRTETFKLIYPYENDSKSSGVLSASCNTKIYYKDVVSLYPTVMFYDYFPVGHPEIVEDIKYPVSLNENMEWFNQLFGFVKCKVTPPKDLYIPVLPHICKDTEKLTFDLNNKKGTWTTEELKLAVKKGYVIDKIYEILNFKEKSNMLFLEYIKKFLKIKQECDSFPSWVDEIEDKKEKDKAKDKYIADYEKVMGIKLEKDKIKKNPGLRAIAKLCLNSLWGKFAQRLNMTQSCIIKINDENEDIGRNEFYNLLFNKTLIINNVNIINEKTIEVSYKSKEEFVESSGSSNVYVGAFTTSNARIRLYNELDKLKENVLYCDTDSIIYAQKGDSYNIPSGSNLGNWTDELKGHYIDNFISTGPKSYTYHIADCEKEHCDCNIVGCNKCKNNCKKCIGGKYVCKVKGFSLNHKNSKKINFNTMKELILGDADDEDNKITLSNKSMITRNKKTKCIENRSQDKDFKLTFNKREILTNYDTLPFGHENT